MRITEKEIKLKDGRIIPIGQPVTFDKESARTCNVEWNNVDYHVRITSAFEKPDLETLKEWMDEGGCETPSGEWTEPDGHGPDGSPSWMMVLGFC